MLFYGKSYAAATTGTLLEHTHTRYDNVGRTVQTDRKLMIPTGVTTNRTITLTEGALDNKPSGDWISQRTEYDRLDRPTFTIADDDYVSRVSYKYDGMGRLLEAEDAQGFMLQNWYDDNSNLIETKRTDVATTTGTNAETFTTTNYYDSLDRLVLTVDNAGHATDYRYDPRGLVLAVADANGPNATARTFYRRGATSSAVNVNNIGNVRLTAYDGLGRRKQETVLLTSSGKGDGTNIGRSSISGAATTLPTVDTGQSADGKITTAYTYGANGMLASLADDNGNRTTWAYDVQNRKKSETKGIPGYPGLADHYNQPTTLQWSYTTRGQINVYTKEDGGTLTHTYDDNGRLTQIDISRATGVGGTTQQTFAYDGLGRLLSATDNNDPSNGFDNMTSTKAYDSLGRVIEEAQTTYGNTHYVSSDYASNERSSLVYPSGRRIDFSYHLGGQLHEVVNNGGSTVAQYDYIGSRVLRRALGKGVDLDLRDGSGTYYDTSGRATQWLHRDTNQMGSPVAIGFDYEYDRVGNVTAFYPQHNPTDEQTFIYDSASRLMFFERQQGLADQPEWQRWYLDGVGNWSTLDQSVWGNYSTQSREVTNFNEYHNIDGVGQSQDDNGNLTNDGNQKYEYDSLNRLILVKDSGNSPIAYYKYDALNRRTVRSIYQLFDHEYSYDGWQILEEAVYDFQEQFWKAKQFVYGGYIDEPLTMDVDEDSGDNVFDASDATYFYHQNQIYSVYGLTDAGGDIVEAYEYDPYGRHILLTDGNDLDSMVNFGANDVRAAQGASSIGQPFLFTGREFDGESEVYNYRNRTYSSYQGRFLTRDPLPHLNSASESSIDAIANNIPNISSKHLNSDLLFIESLTSPYLYASSGPLLYTDPFGLTPSEACLCGDDVSSQVKSVITRVHFEFNKWSWRKKFSQCRSLKIGQNVLNGWDINELQAGSDYANKCATGKCEKTVMLDKKFYYQHGVNYVLWGTMAHLCGWDSWEMERLIEYRSLLLAGSRDMGEERSKLKWAKAGFNLWPFTPSPPADRKDCDTCPHKDSWPKTFTARWGGETIRGQE